MDSKDLTSAIRKVIYRELIWHKVYPGKVLDVDDEKKRGRVKVAVFDLGFNTEENGLWCESRDKNSMSVPGVDSWVEVGFLFGDRDKPYYRGVANEMQESLSKNYDGDAKTHVIFEDPDSDESSIIYSGSDGVLKIMGDDDFAVRFNELKSAFDELKGDLNTLITTYNTHTHTGVTTGLGSTGTTPSTGTTSNADVSNAKIDNIKVP